MNNLTKSIGIGCWQIGGYQEINGINNGWNALPKNQSIKLIEQAIQLGFTFFDTAIGYGNGESEKILGAGIYNSNKKDKIRVCTKVSSQQLEEYGGYNWRSLEKLISESLARLNVDKIDTLLFHSPSQDFISVQYKELFEEAKSRSLIKDYGISARSFDDLTLATQKGFGNVYQWNFSLLEKRAINYLNNITIATNYSFIGRSLLFRGLLTERFLTVGPNFVFNDARSQLSQDLLDWVYSNIFKIKEIAESVGLTISELAILYGANNPTTRLGLVGIRSFDNLNSLEKLINLSQLNIEICYRAATRFEASHRIIN